MLPYDWIIEAFGRERLKIAKEVSKELLCEDVMSIFNCHLEPGVSPSSKFDEIRRAIEVIELSLIMAVKSDNEETIVELSASAFKFYRVLELPENSTEKLKQMIKTSCFGILGNKNVDVRRWLKDNEIPSTFNECENWAKKVFFDVGVAFLLNVRKNGWRDLEKVSDIIQELRESQREFEGEYLRKDVDHSQSAAFELIALYHLAKIMDIVSIFFRNGKTPQRVLNDIDFHYDKSLEVLGNAGIAELALIVTWMRFATKLMVKNSVWWILTSINHNITRFVKKLASKDAYRPIFELWPPQNKALLEEGLMDPAKRAVVIEMPTSSGKTLLAEFRILQTKQNYPESWIAYIVPTRALVNQITNRLREDLSDLGIKTESAIPAFELDPIEEELLKTSEAFDVLVTTQEKLDLLIRGRKIDPDVKPLGLVIVDEAHNIKNGERGLRTELLLATINREFEDVHFLLLSPFIPNVEELANWLDSERSAKISIRWRPNEQLVGLVYPKGRGRNWNIEFKPLYTSPSIPTIVIRDRLIFDKSNLISKNKSSLTKSNIASVVASILSIRSGVIVFTRRKDLACAIAQQIYELFPQLNNIPPEIDLVRNYIAAEFGVDYQLYLLLEKGVAFHHAGVSPEMRYLLEWLTRKGYLKVMVATTTLAQGINFPISSIVINAYKVGQPPEPMSSDEFWNIAGRAGRAEQETLGIIAFTSLDEKNDEIEQYVKKSVSDLMSYLEQIIINALKIGQRLDFTILLRNNPEWSNFIQYLCHAYRQINDHTRFLKETEILIKATYGYQRIEKANPALAHSVIRATMDYAKEIQKIDYQVLYLVDQTGFSPDSIRELRQNTKDLKFTINDWSASGLFSTTNHYLKDIVGNLLRVPELDITYKRGKIEGGSLAELLTKWVNGAPISNIAEMSIFKDENRTKAITECIKSLINIVNYASWGMGALETLSLKKEDIEKLDKRSQLEIRSIPSMIFFGVNSIEGVVMRNLGVSRSIANSLGERFRQETGDETPSLIKARSWLKEIDERIWEQCVPSGSRLNGPEYKKIWQIMNGEYR